jgi:hypothetical protein
MWDAARANQIWMSMSSACASTVARGVIVIFDRVRDAPTAHVPSCARVQEAWFVQKMVEMEGKNGRSWWFERFSVAELGARRCTHCG